ncbi:MAG: hypothetical protein ACXWH0_02500 [Acidimicrobiia bacterium]
MPSRGEGPGRRYDRVGCFVERSAAFQNLDFHYVQVRFSVAVFIVILPPAHIWNA